MIEEFEKIIDDKVFEECGAKRKSPFCELKDSPEGEEYIAPYYAGHNVLTVSACFRHDRIVINVFRWDARFSI
jgi:hypothetical protein